MGVGIFRARTRMLMLVFLLAASTVASGCSLSNLRTSPEAPTATATAQGAAGQATPVFQLGSPTPALAQPEPTRAATRAPASPTTAARRTEAAAQEVPTRQVDPTATPSPAPAPGDGATTVVNGPLAEQQAVVQVVERLSPAVVTVINRLDPAQNRGYSGLASGSGVIVDEAGYIITNNHVIEGQSTLQVIYSDGTSAPARLIGTDRFTDLAVLKVDGAVPAVAQLGDSDQLRVGEMVIAIGSALGEFENTVTVGVVSGLNRVLQAMDDVDMENMIQTDAAINHGNSGGPLINLRGEVVGINTAVVRGSGAGDVAEGLGFAIPVNTVKTISTQLIESGRVARPFLGISSRTISRQVASYFGLRGPNGELLDYGVLVTDVGTGTPAAQAGIRAGDVIGAIGGQQINERDSLLDVLLKHRVGETVTVDVIRDGQALQLEVTLGERPGP